MSNTPSPSPAELKRMREKSGNVIDNRPLVTFLYKLMRDEITPGRIEELLLQAGIDEPVTTPHDVSFTNGWLAAYAQDLAWRLTGWDHSWPVAEDLSYRVSTKDGSPVTEIDLPGGGTLEAPGVLTKEEIDALAEAWSMPDLEADETWHDDGL